MKELWLPIHLFRESVIALAKQLCGEKYFLSPMSAQQNLIDNWDYAAIAKQQSMIVVLAGGVRVIGPEAKSSTKALLDVVLGRNGVSTANVAKSLNISVQNASTRLKNFPVKGLS
ncbi:hypothetical protein [Klebsiella pneumoniae]|uniref:hypothetical protein n=1 Tax=Klebsiella pneumoniae TaxID=573 RepID=UPI001E361438